MLDLLDAALVQHPALIEHRQTITQVLNEVDVVFDDDQRTLRSDRTKEFTCYAALFRAHSSGRLIEQEQFRPARQRKGDLEPLLMTMA